MKITFLKDHLDYRIGDSVEVEIDQANYFISCQVAKKTELKTKK